MHESSTMDQAPQPGLPIDQTMVPKYDYTALPLAQEIGMLRSLGQQILLAALLEKQLPELTGLLAKEQTKFNLPKIQMWLTLLRRYRAYGRQSLLADGRLIIGDSFRQLRQRRWRASYQAIRQLPPRFVYTMLLNRLERALGNVSPQNVPDDLWALMAEAAWGDLAFQHEIATALRTYLRQTVLFTQRDKALVLFSPYTFWVLLALAPIPTALSFDWLTRDYWLYRWAAQRLQRAAAHHVLNVTQWAGFWDQWAIWAAMSQRPDAIVALSPPLYNALMALPIFQFTRASKLWSSQNEQVATVSEPQVASLGQVGDSMPTLSEPAWQAAMPGWFHEHYVHPTPYDRR